jgi:tyrosinase
MEMSGNASSNTRTRKNVWTLGQPGDDLDWYAKAVGQLRTAPLNSPTGWRYMAAVHGYIGQSQDPFATQGDQLPSSADQRKFWNQCQHQTWFFLPWHRGYIAYFEQIVAATVVQLGGPAGWSLPYWNYSDATNPNARSLPPAFLDQTSALWVDGRNLVAPTDALPPNDVSLEALSHTPFEGAVDGGDPGFGGPTTGFNHGGQTNGRLENLPHNVIHDDVGGLMGDPRTAALDPIFWLHHANIDRLWDEWIRQGGAFTNPQEAAWLTDLSFVLHDATGAVVSFTPSQMLDTTQVLTGYQYDRYDDPIPPPATT